MEEHTGDGGHGIDPAAVARRVEEQRSRLNLTDEALASQAGMSPRYLRHLMESGPDFDPGGFLRIATALDLTYRQLVEEEPDGAPPSAEGERLVLRRLSVTECWNRIGAHGVGRVALPVQPGPAVFPVHYAVDDRTVVYRTTPDGPAAPVQGAVVSFQADHTDDRLREGWSVLVTGPAEWIADPEESSALTRAHAGQPWVGGDRNQWVRIRPEAVSGRRVGPG